MFINYIKIALRNIYKNKVYSFINIFGLGFGITCFILISIYLTNELSYDNFHVNSENIFRVLRTSQNENNKYNIGYTSGPYAQALLNDYPADIEQTTRVMANDGLIEYGDNVFKEERLFFADPNFFDFFNYPLLAGDKEKALSDANNIIISREMSAKYFGDKNPIGEVLLVDKNFEFKVTGVFESKGLNSHLKFDFLGSLLLFEKYEWFSGWWNNSLSTYIKTPNPALKSKLINDFPNFMEKYFGDDFARTGNKIGLTLEELDQIYFNNETQFDFVEHGNKSSIYLFSIIALFILVIACINFMNLSIAVSSGRSKEVGLRKVIGADRKTIAFQFIGEAVIFSSISFALALLLVELLLPYFSTFVGKQLFIPFNIFNISAAAAVFIMIIGIISGSYPAFVLASVKPAKILKGENAVRKGKNLLRQILVTAQFTISIILIIGTIIISKQMNYLSNKKLGFSKDQIVVLDVDNNNFRNNIDRFKNELEREPGVKYVSAMSGEPGGFHDNLSYKVAEKGGDYIRMRSLFCDENYLKTFGMELLAGRDFSEARLTDKSEAMILNETAAKVLGYSPQEALGKSIEINLFDSTYRKVVGVVKDYNFTSLKNKIEPLAIACVPDNYRKVAIKIQGEEISGTINTIQKVYAEVSPGYPFDYQFLDEKFDRLYKSEKKTETLFVNFSFTAIIIACMGLLGLVMYSAELKRKEIGIRKVLGSSVSGIVGLITKEFLVLIVLSNVIAWPVSYYFMNGWLSDFAYKINIGLDVFILSAVFTLTIALLTVSFQAIKAALANPVDSIKYE